MHNVESRSLRYTLASAGLAASLIFLFASAVANYRYGYNLARTPTDGMLYGTAAAAGDVFMAASPFFFFAAIRNRAFMQAFAAMIVWAATTLFAAQAAVSHAAVNRLDAISARSVAATSYADTRAELDQARKERGFIPAHRPIDTVKAEMERHKVNRLWSQTTECTEATGKVGRDYCATYHTLSAELGFALQGAKLDARIADLTDKADNVARNNASVQADADPGAGTISRMSGLDVRTVQGLSIFMVAFVILLGAGLGPYVSMSVLQVRQPKPASPEAAPAMLVAATPALPAPDPTPPPSDVTPVKAPSPMPGVPDAVAMLKAMDFPTGQIVGDKRPQEDTEISAIRFLAWIAAYQRGGEYTADAFDALYAEFCEADYRHPCGMRVVKPALEHYRRYVTKTAPVAGKRPTMWEATPPPLPKMVDLLKAKGAIIEDAEVVEETPREAGNVFRLPPFRSAR